MFAAATCAASPAVANKKRVDKKNCLDCHAVDEQGLGPSLKEGAVTYAGDAKAADMLAGKIQKSGVGAWGQVPMPANDVMDDDAQWLTTWVLGQKQQPAGGGCSTGCAQDAFGHAPAMYFRRAVVDAKGAHVGKDARHHRLAGDALATEDLHATVGDTADCL